jgi:hypothetical protein
MNAFAHSRTSERFPLQAPVILEDFRMEFNYDGMMYNYSTGGGYVESAYAPRPGRKIRIKIDGVPDIVTPHIYLAEIRWRKPLPENTRSHTYGLGLKYC